MMRFALFTSLLCSLLLSVDACLAAAPATDGQIRAAWTLYTQRKYVPAADAFEVLIRTSTPASGLYYYAAAANKAAGRLPRAKQLAAYIRTHFSRSPEAGYLVQLFPEDAPAASATASLPAHLRGKSVDELMTTDEGRLALLAAANRASAGPGATSSATKTSYTESSTTTNGDTSTTTTTSQTTISTTTTSRGKSSRPRDAVFTADIIAAENADGITQFVSRPDAGFECSLAAMALLPRGREMIADMIRCPSAGQDIYIVRFPNGAAEYTITPAKMEKYQMKDSALWATLIHGAVRESPASHLEDGLSILTGNRAEKIFASSTSQPALASFIGDAVRKQHPIVCLSLESTPSPELVEDFAGYTITGFDSSTGLVTLRNPHGSNSRRFRLETDPLHKQFEQMNNGYFKMHLSLFSKYFKEVARASI